MIYFGRTFLKETIRQTMAALAESGIYNGALRSEQDRQYIRRCTAFHAPSGSRIIYTKDTGYHTSGWWKNPDYERCFHLSLSFVDPISGEPAPTDKKLTSEWLELFFGENQKYLWCEPAYYDLGKKLDVWHYRLFCEEGWQPKKPRKEVYSLDFTEIGWKRFS